MNTSSKKPVFKSADEIIRLMLESKKQSKIESQEFAKTQEFQDMLVRLRAMKKKKNAL
ncbi:hypothetical protein [Flavobacterium sp.]|uniref:hypothetical protein n=1 Tax=Flavobacterium sp. TaxID=239 RepID=UPI00286C9DD7|nr:hypothetical protein [Flavobacterium sp.]